MLGSMCVVSHFMIETRRGASSKNSIEHYETRRGAASKNSMSTMKREGVRLQRIRWVRRPRIPV